MTTMSAPVKLAHRWHVRLMIALAAALLALGILALTAPAPHAQASVRSSSWSALKWAEGQAGKWYCWGGAGPSCYDCSGLVMAAYSHMGYGLPHSTYSMLSSGRIYRVSAGQRRQGDLAFFGSGHVELVTRHGTFGALNSGSRIGWHAITAYWHPSSYWRIR